MARVLITVTPLMYRQAIEFSIRRQRPGCDVRIAAPEDAEGELAAFRPHLLVHDDSDGLPVEAMAGVLCRVTVLYSDGMDARIDAEGEISRTRDMSTEDLLEIVDAVIATAEG
jgi:hypothetical protein